MTIREGRKLGAIARLSFLISAIALTIAGCAGSSSVESTDPGFVEHSIRTLAVEPSDDLFADDRLAQAIGVQLARRGYTVDDARQTVALLENDNVKSLDILTPGGLAVLRKNGVDAILSISAAPASMGGPPMRYVKVRILSAVTGKEIGTLDWKNSWAGMPGSIADYVNRKGVDSAAAEIADKLSKLLG